MVTGWPKAADRLTVKVAFTEPVLPSVTDTSLMLTAGAVRAGQAWSLTRTAASPPEELAVAASGHPSPLKSPAASPFGYEPTAALTAEVKVPLPLPRITLTSWEE